MELFLLHKTAGKTLWVKRNNLDLWCAGAYIINRDKIRTFTDALMQESPIGRMLVKVIAAYGNIGEDNRAGLPKDSGKLPCHPKECCDGNLFVETLPCVYAPRGYQADHLLYMLGPTYVLTAPLLSSASLGNTSTFHQVGRCGSCVLCTSHNLTHIDSSLVYNVGPRRHASRSFQPARFLHT